MSMPLEEGRRGNRRYRIVVYHLMGPFTEGDYNRGAGREGMLGALIASILGYIFLAAEKLTTYRVHEDLARNNFAKVS